MFLTYPLFLVRQPLLRFTPPLSFPSFMAPHPVLGIGSDRILKFFPERASVRIRMTWIWGLKLMKNNLVMSSFGSLHFKVKEICVHPASYFFRIIYIISLMVKKTDLVFLRKLIWTMIGNKATHPRDIIPVKQGSYSFIHRHYMGVPSWTQLLKDWVP